jgi:hypothetical protein
MLLNFTLLTFDLMVNSPYWTYPRIPIILPAESWTRSEEALKATVTDKDLQRLYSKERGAPMCCVNNYWLDDGWWWCVASERPQKAIFNLEFQAVISLSFSFLSLYCVCEGEEKKTLKNHKKNQANFYKVWKICGSALKTSLAETHLREGQHTDGRTDVTFSFGFSYIYALGPVWIQSCLVPLGPSNE